MHHIKSNLPVSHIVNIIFLFVPYLDSELWLSFLQEGKLNCAIDGELQPFYTCHSFIQGPECIYMHFIKRNKRCKNNEEYYSHFLIWFFPYGRVVQRFINITCKWRGNSNCLTLVCSTCVRAQRAKKYQT